MSKKILIIGCGQLGSRHLQAVASLEEVGEIHIVDLNDSSLELGRSRLNEISDKNEKIKFQWFNELQSSSEKGDLCIVATQAKGRCQIVKQIAKQLGYKNFLIEKIVSQSLEEYKDLMTYAEQNDLSIWVNCKSRGYSIHKYIKPLLDPAYPIIFSDLGGNHGLANYGIHAADLFVYYDEIDEIESFGSHIDPIVHPSKRGSDIVDLSGTLCGYSKKGSHLTLTFAAGPASPDHVYIANSRCRFIVDHFQPFACESYAESDWKWQNIPIKADWKVSYMTKTFVSDILLNGRCDLPTLLECFPAHKFILSELQPHFNRLLNQNNNFCPVT